MITIKRIHENDKNILDNLLQLYLHNISLYFKIDFDSNTGKYVYDSLDKYFSSSTNHAYFIEVNENIAGFILVDQVDAVNIIQEMFVLNNYKKQGIGTSAIKQVFDLYKGNWCIKSLPLSNPAELFWNKVVKEYTNDNYVIEHVGKYNRAVFSFKN